MTKRPLQILVADDQAVVRTGVKEILRHALKAEFGEATNARETIDSCHKAKWDIILLDISMPGRSGLDVLGDLKACCPKTPVLVLSMHDETLFAERALRAGAAGYITKATLPEDLIKAVQKVLAGERYVSEQVVQNLVAAMQSGNRTTPHETLSAREFEVLTMIVAGRSGKEIAADLAISFKTVSTYRKRLMQKLGVSSNAELARYAVREGLE